MDSENSQGCGLYANWAKDMDDAEFVLNELEREVQAAGWEGEIGAICDRSLFALARLLGACRAQEVPQNVREHMEHHDVLGALGNVYDKACWLHSVIENGLVERQYPIILKILNNFLNQAKRKGVLPEE